MVFPGFSGSSVKVLRKAIRIDSRGIPASHRGYVEDLDVYGGFREVEKLEDFGV